MSNHGYGGAGDASSGYMSGHFVHMRGLPFRAREDDVAHFFSPLNPLRIHLEYGSDGRATGEADVEFATHEDAVAAMSKDKAHMRTFVAFNAVICNQREHRYIELFLNSTAGGGSGYGSNYGGHAMGNQGGYGSSGNHGMSGYAGYGGQSNMGSYGRHGGNSNGAGAYYGNSGGMGMGSNMGGMGSMGGSGAWRMYQQILDYEYLASKHKQTMLPQGREEEEEDEDEGNPLLLGRKIGSGKLNMPIE
eukprot:g46710.t1